MKYTTLLLLLLSFSSHAGEASFDDVFSVVFIDDETEQRYGDMPLDRSYLAKAIHKLAEAGAKGVILKFFVDRASNHESDHLLSASLEKLPVVLQARIDNTEPFPNTLPSKFVLRMPAKTGIEGESGWIPAPVFAAKAHDIGFVDFNGYSISMLETYQHETVKSLFISALELGLNEKARIAPSESVSIANTVIELDKLNQVSVDFNADEPVAYLPFHVLIETTNWLEKVKNRVVILGYNGRQIPKVKTVNGSFAAHSLFVYVLQLLYNDGR